MSSSKLTPDPRQWGREKKSEDAMGAGFAVIDVETTGLFPEKHDRIVEVGIVHVSPSGEITGRWGTIVNPMRDMGPQHIHGISAAMASRGPTFDAVAPHIAELLSDRVPVAHNASFDARFLGFQMAEAGIPIASAEYWLCTMKLAQSFLRGGPRSLRDCCEQIGIAGWDAHAALDDAMVAAALLGHYLRSGYNEDWWQNWLATARIYPSVSADPIEWIGRDASKRPSRTLLERLSVAVADDGQTLNVDYLALLDRILLDRFVSLSETQSLVTLAAQLGIGQEAAARTHRAYFDGVVSAAWSDNVLTEAEIADIRAVGRALDIPAEYVDAAVRERVSAGPTFSSGFALQPGDVIVITGETRRSRPEWFALLESRGFVAKDNIVKTAKVLVAADPDSMSGKAQKAREYGIPIINENGLERLTGI